MSEATNLKGGDSRFTSIELLGLRQKETAKRETIAPSCENCQSYFETFCFNETLKAEIGFPAQAATMRGLWSMCGSEGNFYKAK